MFFNIGAGEMILIALVLLIAVGPEQLPGLVRRAGRTMGQVRSMTEGLRGDFMSSMDELERAADPRKWTDVDLDLDADVKLDPAVEKEESPPFEMPPIAVPPPFSSSKDLNDARKAAEAEAKAKADGAVPAEDESSEPFNGDPQPVDESLDGPEEVEAAEDHISTDSSYDGLVDVEELDTFDQADDEDEDVAS